MQTEILPVSLEDKAAVTTYIRQNSIPSLVEKDLGAEKSLQILQRIGTWRSQLGTIESDHVISGYILFYGGINPLPEDAFEREQALAEFIARGNNQFSPLGNYLRGNYRVLGCFAPNVRLAEFAPEAGNYFTGAIPVSTANYRSPESPAYYPPVFNIHKPMASICTKYDDEIVHCDTPDEIAHAVVRFYFWGLVMTHPFLGGNHRGYDRFIELAFAAKDMPLLTPQNETLNIPNNDPFNLSLFEERTRLLKEANLDHQTFDLHGWKDVNDWLTYQHNLNEAFTDWLNDDSARLDEAVAAILNWR